MKKNISKKILNTVITDIKKSLNDSNSIYETEIENDNDSICVNEACNVKENVTYIIFDSAVSIWETTWDNVGCMIRNKKVTSDIKYSVLTSLKSL